ncbi:MAG: DUF4199 domain-containing protein, partial [Flavobacteriales bacterium]|nr:DUF4199 domain-containing protein [Flavobacteriales bacterium]
MDTRKFAMNYGAVLGLFLVAIAVIMWSVGADDKQSVIPNLLNNGITIAFITYAIIQYREINNNGFITYAESLKLGTTVAFFSSIIMAFYQFIYISYLDPNSLSEIMKITEQSMLESDPEISDERLDKALQMTSKFMQPHWMMILGTLGGTFMGFLYSLIISIFVKKTENIIHEDLETSKVILDSTKDVFLSQDKPLESAIIKDDTITNQDVKQCPFCLEEINKEARKCKFCHEYLEELSDKNNNVYGEGKERSFLASMMYVILWPIGIYLMIKDKKPWHQTTIGKILQVLVF